MKLSILIVNWNSKDYLRGGLLAIRRTCSSLSLQVVVVDGGSFDGCAEMLALEFPEVEFVQIQENIGFGRANNLGFGKVTGEALLLLNPDTELRPGALEVLLENLWKLPEAGLVGARLLNFDETLQLSSVHALPTAWNIALDSDWLRRRRWQKKGPLSDAGAREVEAVSGACMLLRSETFLELGGFDSKYFMYAEDMDLCFKVRRSGLKIYHVPQARVLHHGGGSSRTQFSKFSAIMIREALGIYILSNHGYFQMCVYKLLMALSAGLRICLLFSSLLFVTGETRLNSRGAILKWWTIFRWCLGLESWAKSQFRFSGELVSLAAEAFASI